MQSITTRNPEINQDSMQVQCQQIQLNIQETTTRSCNISIPS